MNNKMIHLRGKDNAQDLYILINDDFKPLTDDEKTTQNKKDARLLVNALIKFLPPQTVEETLRLLFNKRLNEK